MANRQRAEARRKAQAKSSRSPGEGGGSKLGIWIGLAAVIALVVGIVVFVGGGDDSNSNASDNTSVPSGLASLPVSQPVTITGDSLTPFDATLSPDPAVGLDAPVLSGLNFSGEPIVADPADGPYMLVFLAHWCPHCNAEVPRLNDWKNSGAVPPELNVIGVATAVSSASENFPPAVWFSNKGWQWPVIVDEANGDGGEAGKAAQAFGASGWPYFVIVGADGKVKARVSGQIEVADLQAIVDAALAA